MFDKPTVQNQFYCHWWYLGWGADRNLWDGKVEWTNILRWPKWSFHRKEKLCTSQVRASLQYQRDRRWWVQTHQLHYGFGQKSSADESYNDRKEIMVAALAGNYGELQLQYNSYYEEGVRRRRLLVAKNRYYLAANKRRKMEGMLYKVDAIAWSVHDLKGMTLPCSTHWSWQIGFQIFKGLKGYFMV